MYEELGRRVRRARETAGLSQAELAQRIGMSRTSVTNIELGTQRVPLHVVFDLASALDTSVNRLLPTESGEERREMLENIPARERAWVRRVIRGGRTVA